MKEGQQLFRSRRWAPPVLAYRGTVGEILNQGGGKVTFTQGDPGEPMKCPSGQQKQGVCQP